MTSGPGSNRRCGTWRPDVLELVTGVIVTIAVLALVMEPLLSRRRPAPLLPGITDLVEDLEESRSPEIRALLAPPKKINKPRTPSS